MVARVVIVGAGPNGLAAAVTLARAGRQVLVYEAADRPGGGTRSAELTLPGFIHDTCSAVHPMGAASPFFRALPMAEHGLEWVHPELPMAHPFDDGTAATLARSTHETALSLDRADVEPYQELMDPFVERWSDLFDDALRPLLRVPDHPLLIARFGRVGLRSALGLGRARFHGARARALLAGIAAHTLEPLDLPPTAAFGLMLAVAGHCVGWPFARGGSQRIADALIGLLERRGGSVVTGSPVRSLDPLPSAEAIVLDLTPKQVLAVAGPRLTGHYRRQLERWRYGPGVFKLDWALCAPIPWRADACRRAGTVHLGGRAEEIAASNRAAWEGRLPERPFVLLAQPTLFDPSRAPAGRHIAWAYCHVPNGSTADLSEAIEAQVERFAPGFRDVILARASRSAAASEHYDPNLVGGDINGGIADLRQLLFRPAVRADPYATPVHGLFLCSASTPPGGGAHGMCGHNAALSVLRHAD